MYGTLAGAIIPLRLVQRHPYGSSLLPAVRFGLLIREPRLRQLLPGFSSSHITAVNAAIPPAVAGEAVCADRHKMLCIDAGD